MVNKVRGGRNSEIELLRFLFACSVALGHYHIMYGMRGFAAGGMGVEFFFLLSGLLMARSADRITNHYVTSVTNIGETCWDFLKHKIAAFYPYYLGAMLLQTVYRNVLGQWGLIYTGKQLLAAIPQFLLTEVSGAYVGTSVALSGRWYLSAMVLSMAILYPILIKFGNCASKILFPLIAMLGLGFLQGNYGTIVRNYDWNGYVENGMIRALGEIALGVACYEIAKWFMRVNLTKLAKGICVVIKLFVYMIGFLYLVGYIALEPLTFLVLMAIGVIFSYSKIGAIIPDGNPICMFLGKISLPLYVFHVPAAEMISKMIADQNGSVDITVLLFCCTLSILLFKWLIDFIIKVFKQYGTGFFVMQTSDFEK